MNQDDSNLASGALTGAASGASLGSVAGPWGTLIGGVVGAGVGLYGAYTQNEADDNRPKYEIPSEIKANLSQAQQQALQGLPEEQKAQFIKNMQRQTAYGLGQASSRKAGLIGISGMNQQNNDALENLSVADAQARMANQDKLSGARSQMADYKGQEFQINQENPYYEGKAQQQAQRGANLDSINNAVNTGVNVYGQYKQGQGNQYQGYNTGAYNSGFGFNGGNNQAGNDYNPDGTLATA